MKLKTFLIAAAVVLFAACDTPYQATDASTAVVVPDATRTAFSDQYPNATNIVWANYDPAVEPMIDWELSEWAAMDAGDYLVSFNMDNEMYYAWYDSDGNWVGTAYIVSDYTKLPSAVNTTVTTKFTDYSITRVHREFHKDRVAYEIVLTRSSDQSIVKLLVDNDGNIIRQKPKP
ncbi:MAG TPA: PepSY-like domain-containing protein [Chitinophagaceae bacterium]|nr:PepSY-like domain-containing protein [Chitinophagaceae bacterium]